LLESVGIKPEDLTTDVWDFIMLEGPMPKGSKIPAETLKKMQKERMQKKTMRTGKLCFRRKVMVTP